MNRVISIVLLLLGLLFIAVTLASAQDYYWVQSGPVTLSNLAANVRGLDVTDRDDMREYLATGLPVPTPPALVHRASGLVSFNPPTIRAGKRSIQAQQEAAISNGLPDRVLGYLTPGTNITAIITTNSLAWRSVRYSGTMTAGQQREYDRYCIEYLSARLQVLEMLLAEKGVVNVRKTLDRDTE